MKSFLILALFILCFGSLGISAQVNDVVATTYFPGEQPVSVDLPLPRYPKEAKKAGYGGRVSIAVTVDETGNVSSIDKVDGPTPFCSSFKSPQIDALRLAASNAALKARFKPMFVDGHGASIKGRINYEFVNEDVGKPTSDSKKSMSGFRIVGTASDTGTLGGTSGEPVDVAKGADKTLPKTISGGVLNNSAMDLATPVYPPAARAVRASGPVSVQVVINEDGTMISAAALNGHPLLRSSSEIAACNSRFKPTLLSGHPVKVSGIIVYNYVP